MTTPTAPPISLFGGGVRVEGRKVTVERPDSLRSDAMDALVREAVFGDEAARDHARWLVWEIAQAAGVHPWSINDLYLARGRGETHGFTVPAINVRAMAYDTARSIFRTAIKLDAGAFILEIARSEIAYTDQRPAEYVVVMLAAALREGFRGPVFIQGDHFQVSAKKFVADPKGEVDAVKSLAKEAITAGFYNIDVDTSTLVDLSKPSLEEQQRANYETGADIAAFIRDNEPAGVTISIGGEIGEVGTQNSTPAELVAYMDGFDAALSKRSPRNTEGLSKISVQSGTSHGGVVMADGSIADVKLDLETLRALSVLAREKYGLAGAVQHGASTLPDSAFHSFPRSETAEIHLATNFQNMLFDHLPAALRQEIYDWLRTNAKDERKTSDSDEQFFYKTRKKAIGPFKKKVWDLPEDVRRTIGRAYDAKFEFLFNQLAIGGTKDTVSRFVRPAVLH
ncbi:MAG: class II fructose-bisphosphate aldolase, partial [Gemmatimonadaceae bacterium]